MKKMPECEIIPAPQFLKSASETATLLHQYVVQYYKAANDGGSDMPEDNYPTFVFRAPDDEEAKKIAEAYIQLNTYSHYRFEIKGLARMAFSRVTLDPHHKPLERACGSDIRAPLEGIVSSAHFVPLTHALFPQDDYDDYSPSLRLIVKQK